MDCSIVAISRSLGAGGEEIAHRAAEKLGFRYVDDEIIERAAKAAGVSPETLSEVEHTQPLIIRILASLAAIPPDPVYFVVEEMPLPTYTSHEYSDLITQVIEATANEGQVVIVAHGASIPLAGIAGLLRVFVTASPAVRAARIAAEAKLSERDARRAVDESDKQRHEFLNRFYRLHQELPVHYDLVISTDVLPFEEAARLIVTAARG